jgi:hypothetical protein
VTSAFEVLSPSATDFIEVLFYQGLDGPNLLLRKALILRQRDGWLKPEFRFPVGTLHVNVHSEFLAREKVKPIGTVAEYGWTHDADSTTPSEQWEWCT